MIQPNSRSFSSPRGESEGKRWKRGLDSWPVESWIGSGKGNFEPGQVWVMRMPKLEWTQDTVEVNLYVYSMEEGQEKRWCGIIWERVLSGWLGKDFWGDSYCAVQVREAYQTWEVKVGFSTSLGAVHGPYYVERDMISTHAVAPGVLGRRDQVVLQPPQSKTHEVKVDEKPANAKPFETTDVSVTELKCSEIPLAIKRLLTQHGNLFFPRYLKAALLWIRLVHPGGQQQLPLALPLVGPCHLMKKKRIY